VDQQNETRKHLKFQIEGWLEGHPHLNLTKIDGYPFGYVTPLNPNPLLDNNHDGYASSFRQRYRQYQKDARTDRREFSLNMEDF
jgi:hypothetical protein